MDKFCLVGLCLITSFALQSHAKPFHLDEDDYYDEDISSEDEIKDVFKFNTKYEDAMEEVGREKIELSSEVKNILLTNNTVVNGSTSFINENLSGEIKASAQKNEDYEIDYVEEENWKIEEDNRDKVKNVLLTNNTVVNGSTSFKDENLSEEIEASAQKNENYEIDLVEEENWKIEEDNSDKVKNVLLTNNTVVNGSTSFINENLSEEIEVSSQKNENSEIDFVEEENWKIEEDYGDIVQPIVEEITSTEVKNNSDYEVQLAEGPEIPSTDEEATHLKQVSPLFEIEIKSDTNIPETENDEESFLEGDVTAMIMISETQKDEQPDNFLEDILGIRESMPYGSDTQENEQPVICDIIEPKIDGMTTSQNISEDYIELSTEAVISDFTLFEETSANIIIPETENYEPLKWLLEIRDVYKSEEEDHNLQTENTLILEDITDDIELSKEDSTTDTTSFEESTSEIIISETQPCFLDYEEIRTENVLPLEQDEGRPSIYDEIFKLSTVKIESLEETGTDLVEEIIVEEIIPETTISESTVNENFTYTTEVEVEEIVTKDNNNDSINPQNDKTIYGYYSNRFTEIPPNYLPKLEKTITAGFHISNINSINNTRVVTVYFDQKNRFYSSILSVRVFTDNTSTLNSAYFYVSNEQYFRHTIPLSEVNIAIECFNDRLTNVEELIVITVPDQKVIIAPPQMITVDYGQGRNTLFWKFPNTDVTNITIYWMDTYQNDSNSYKGVLTYEYLPPNTTSYTWTSDRYEARAISLNSATSSSGIVWPSKIIPAKEVVAFASKVQYKTGADYIDLFFPLLHPEVLDIFSPISVSVHYEPANATNEDDEMYRLFRYSEFTTANVTLANLRDDTQYDIQTLFFIKKGEAVFMNVYDNLTISTDSITAVFILQ